MLTTSHAYWTWRAARSRPARWAAVAGAVAPDAPAVALAAVGLAHGRRGDRLLGWVYRRPGVAPVHLAAHSALAPAALLALGGRPAWRALAAGWAGHILADALTHHDDAWPHLFPLTRRTWPSPVSYWQRERGARAWTVAEAAALAAAIRADRGAGRRLAGLAALVLAALPLLCPPTWTARPWGREPRGYSSPPTISRGSTHSFSRSTSRP